METTKGFTEQEHPELGRVFRAAPGNDRQKFAAVRDYLRRQFDDGDTLMEESAQTWEYNERSDNGTPRDFQFRVRIRSHPRRFRVRLFPLLFGPLSASV